MIVVVGMNPALDRTLSVPNFTVGSTLKAESVTVLPAGKGANVAAVLHVLGARVRYTGFVGRGEVEQFRNRLAGVPCDIVAVDGATRIDTTIKDPVHGTETHIREIGIVISRNTVDMFITTLLTNTKRGDIVVLAGSLPPGAPDDTYARIIRSCNEQGVLTLLDSSGAALQNGVKARPTFLKPNREELAELTQRSIDGIDDVLRAANELRERGIDAVAVTLGREGAILVQEHGAWFGRAPVSHVVTTVGCGDAFVAGWMAARATNQCAETQLREALCAAAANTLTHGAGVVDADDIARMRSVVTTEQVAAECSPPKR